MIEKKNLPSLDDLIELEKKAKIKGTGIGYESLLGLWKFNSVWKKGSNKKDSISSKFLEVLSASLELKKDTQNHDKKLFTISNSIQFGILSLRFSGVAKLERKQPLLPFSFDCIEIKLASIYIFKRSISTPKNKMSPFYALIAIDSNGRWFSARGKGGGLALWERDSLNIKRKY